MPSAKETTASSPGRGLRSREPPPPPVVANDPIDPHDHPLCDACREIGCECAREWSFVALVCRCGWSLLRLLPPCIPHRVR